MGQIVSENAEFCHPHPVSNTQHCITLCWYINLAQCLAHGHEVINVQLKTLPKENRAWNVLDWNSTRRMFALKC